jgi:hypothetical protein
MSTQTALDIFAYCMLFYGAWQIVLWMMGSYTEWFEAVAQLIVLAGIWVLVFAIMQNGIGS